MCVVGGVMIDRYVFGVPQAGTPYAGSISAFEIILIDGVRKETGNEAY